MVKVDRRANHRIEQCHDLLEKIAQQLIHVERRAQDAHRFEHHSQFALGFFLRVKPREIRRFQPPRVFHFEHAHRPDDEERERGHRNRAEDFDGQAEHAQKDIGVDDIRGEDRRGCVNDLIEQTVPADGERRADEIAPELRQILAQERASLREQRDHGEDGRRHAERIIRPHTCRTRQGHPRQRAQKHREHSGEIDQNRQRRQSAQPAFLFRRELNQQTRAEFKEEEKGERSPAQFEHRRPDRLLRQRGNLR